MDLSIRKNTVDADSGHGDPPPKHPHDAPPVEQTAEDTVEGSDK